LIAKPVKGAAPVTSVANDQYVGTVEWFDNDTGVKVAEGAKFEPGTVYNASVKLTAQEGYSFGTVAANWFTHSDATNITNEAGSVQVTIIFPETIPDPVNLFNLNGKLTAPVYNVAPVTTFAATDQYTGTVTWAPADNPFKAETVYTATVKLTATKKI